MEKIYNQVSIKVLFSLMHTYFHKGQQYHSMDSSELQTSKKRFRRKCEQMGRWNPPHYSTAVFPLMPLHIHTCTYINAYMYLHTYICIHVFTYLHIYIVCLNYMFYVILMHPIGAVLFIISAYWVATLLIKSNHCIIHFKFFLRFIFHRHI